MRRPKIYLLVILGFTTIVSQYFCFADVYGSIRGKILGKDTKKGVKCEISLHARGPFSNVTNMITCFKLDESGEFKILNLDPDFFHTLEVVPPEPYIWPEDIFVDLKGGGIKEVVVVLKVGCVVKGRIIHDGLNLVLSKNDQDLNFSVGVDANIRYFSGGYIENGETWFKLSGLPEGKYIISLGPDNNSETPLSSEGIAYPTLYQLVDIKKGTTIIDNFDLRKENFGELEIIGYSSDNHTLKNVGGSIEGVNNHPIINKPYFVDCTNSNYDRYLLPPGEYIVWTSIAKKVDVNLELPLEEQFKIERDAVISNEFLVRIEKGKKITKEIRYNLSYDEIDEASK